MPCGHPGQIFRGPFHGAYFECLCIEKECPDRYDQLSQLLFRNTQKGIPQLHDDECRLTVLLEVGTYNIV